MKKHEGCIRGYHRVSKAWYAHNYDEVAVSFGMFHPDGGTSGDMSMVWKNIDIKIAPKLEVFDDGWHALSLFTDLLPMMGMVDSESISEPEFCEMLDSCGFKDLTEYTKQKSAQIAHT